MIKIMFVCHGNICRSPMAEFIMKKLVRDAGLESEFEISSCAVSYEEAGNDIYPPAKDELRRRGVPFSSRRAVRAQKQDYDEYDLFVVMDSSNLRNLTRIFEGDDEGKIHKLLEYTGQMRDVTDPWYSGNFDVAFDDIYAGCRALLENFAKTT